MYKHCVNFNRLLTKSNAEFAFLSVSFARFFFYLLQQLNQLFHRNLYLECVSLSLDINTNRFDSEKSDLFDFGCSF